MGDAITEEFLQLVRQADELEGELADLREKIRQTRPKVPDSRYDIALRPDVAEDDPMRYDTLLDDIVVRNVHLFRAEAMDDGEWWVCCYLDPAGDDRICWSVTAKCRPRRIEWNTTEFPMTTDVLYEHELEGEHSG